MRADNHAMIALLHRGAGKMETKLEGGVYHFRFDLHESRPERGTTKKKVLTAKYAKKKKKKG